MVKCRMPVVLMVSEADTSGIASAVSVMGCSVACRRTHICGESLINEAPWQPRTRGRSHAMATPIKKPAPELSQNSPQPDPRIAAAFDIKHLDQAFLDAPYPTYRGLREHDPVHRMPDGSFFLTRYNDLIAVYRNAETWCSDKTVDFKPNFGDSLLYEHHTSSLVFNDPPIHTRVRKLLAPAFAPRALAALRPRIEALVDRLLDRAQERGTFDLIDDFAAAIPIQLIGDLLGIPADARGSLRQWSLDILGALEPVLPKDKFDAGVTSVGDFKDFLKELVGHRRGETMSDDGEILSKLIAGTDLDGGGDGERLSELELLHNCIFLLNAGHETTTNLIGNGVDLLLRSPDALADLAAHPD